MQNQDSKTAHIGSYTLKQQLFIRYFSYILIDLTVLNLFDEFWVHVTIPSFSISLLTAGLLQLLLKITLKIEHSIAAFFKSKSGLTANILKWLSAWAVLFGSKFLILGAINLAFGNQVLFGGPLHGILSFIVVVMVILIAEFLITRLSHFLGIDKES